MLLSSLVLCFGSAEKSGTAVKLLSSGCLQWGASFQFFEDHGRDMAFVECSSHQVMSMIDILSSAEVLSSAAILAMKQVFLVEQFHLISYRYLAGQSSS